MPDDALSPEELSPDEQAMLDRIAPVARRLELVDGALEQPPADLWDRIAAEAFESGAETPPPGEPEAPAPTPITGRRAPRPSIWLAAAAVVAVIAGIVAAIAVLSGTDDADTGTVVATAQLDALTEQANGGTAELVDEDGTLRLRVDAGQLDAGDGFLELWVIDPEVQQLISLGPVRADGLYDLPDGIDPEAFPIVDVSVESFDGDPTHSGDSLVRGQLAF